MNIVNKQTVKTLKSLDLAPMVIDFCVVLFCHRFLDELNLQQWWFFNMRNRTKTEAWYI